MKSSWSIHDFPPAEGELPAPLVEKPYVIIRELTRKEKEAIRFAAIKNRPDRKGRGARKRAGEKRWATKGK
jgi:hypothetical protein